MLFPIVSIRPCKPCYVEDDNLSQAEPGSRASFRFGRFPYQIWVSRLWGLPTFHLDVAIKLVSVAP